MQHEGNGIAMRTFKRQNNNNKLGRVRLNLNVFTGVDNRERAKKQKRRIWLEEKHENWQWESE